jgi:hypothetical protein
MTGDRKFPHLTAAKNQCGTKSNKDQKICCSRAASTPVPRLCGGFFTLSRQPAGQNRGVEACPEKVLGFFDSDMPQLFDFERVPIDQMVPIDWDAL